MGEQSKALAVAKAAGAAIDKMRERIDRQDLLEFQPDLVELEERPAPKAAEWTLFAIVGLIVCAIAWASLAEIDRVVTAEGRLVTTSSRLVVQPLETGVIRAIDVRVGQAVKKGQVLATLDATFTEADTAASRAALATLDAMSARLEAQLSGKRPARFSPDPREDALQAEIFARHQAEVAGSLASLEAEIGALTAELETNQREQQDSRKTQAIAREVEQMRQTLVEKNAGSHLHLLEAQATRAAAERDLNRLVNTAKQIAQKLNGIRERRAAYLGESKSKVAQELQNVRREREKVAEDLKKQERRGSLVQLTAPVDAVVLEVAPRSVGSVASQAEPLVTMVPFDAPLEAEVDIRPQDVAMLRPGDSARVKLEALPYQKHGTLTGRLDVLSGDTLKTEKGPNGQQSLVYRARVTLVTRDLHGVPADFRLIPGMTASAEIKIGTRRVITYFLYPIFRAFDESFREP
jgi:HlyD family secretion protein